MEPTGALEPKTFVLDTSVLAYDCRSLTSFGDNDIVIAKVSIKEFDGLKKRDGEVGANARGVIRIIDGLTEKYPDLIESGMPLPAPAAGKLRIVDINRSDVDPDGQIVLTAQKFRAMGKNVTVVSKDLILRINARTLGLSAEDYTTDRVLLNDLYTGIARIPVEELPRFDGQTREAPLPEEIRESEHEFYPNQFLIFTKDPYERVAIYDKARRLLRAPAYKLKDSPVAGDKIAPRNLEQALFFNLLMDTSIPLVTGTGIAGTGKDLMALLAGYKQLDRSYQHIVIAHSGYAMGGRDIGFLPGTLFEKLEPWCQLFFDNLNLITNKRVESGSKEKSRGEISIAEELIANGELILASLAHSRGITWHNSYIIMTEAQNLTRGEIKTIGTRIGDNSKVIFTGDTQQIDNLRIDASTSGLVQLIERVKHSPLTGHVTLVKSERSAIAELIAETL